MIKPQTSQVDELTGLFNRKAFLEELQTALAQAKAQSGEKPLSLALIDVDKFKAINDEHGHATGDSVLIAIADALRSFCGEPALGGRYGGDEFAVFFQGVEREQAFLKLEQMRAAICQRSFTSTTGEAVQGVAISVGLAAFPLDGRTPTELLRKADQALYRAKVAGRNQVRLAYEERMTPKTSHYTQTQLERLSRLAEAHSVSEADLLREAMDDLLTKYGVNDIES